MDVSHDNIAGFWLGVGFGVVLALVLKLSDSARSAEPKELVR
jgi:hypothetical protein